MKPLPTSFFRRPADVVAPDLLGATIVSTARGRTVSGIIVETEAYLGFDDPASHAYRGRRHAQNEGLYSPPGCWYVYRSYGVHWCANLVVGGAAGSAVLLRAVEPEAGVALMKRRRGCLRERDLANGPGKLCQALGITAVLDGVLMGRSEVRVLEKPRRPADQPTVTPRVGITKAVDWPLRFVLRRTS